MGIVKPFIDTVTVEKTQEIEFAGTVAAFNILEAALRNKITNMNLFCPVTRKTESFRDSITLSAGNFENRPLRSGYDALIKITSLGAAGFLERCLPPLNSAKAYLSGMTSFYVSSTPRNPRNFMDFFTAIGMGPLDDVFDLNAKVHKGIQTGDTKWLAHTEAGLFEAMACGSLPGVRGARVYCCTIGFLNALDISLADFVDSVTKARIKKAEEYGPLRPESHSDFALNIKRYEK